MSCRFPQKPSLPLSKEDRELFRFAMHGTASDERRVHLQEQLRNTPLEDEPNDTDCIASAQPGDRYWPPCPTLDLHGMRALRAERQVLSFIDDCLFHKQRYACIITGKGLHTPHDHTPLRLQVAHWLQRLSYIEVFAHAHPYRGNTGVYDLLLKLP